MTQAQDQIDRIFQRDPRAVARAISAIENESPTAPELLKVLFTQSGRGLVVGVTAHQAQVNLRLLISSRCITALRTNRLALLPLIHPAPFPAAHC
jgi:hypothetical protein